MEPTAHVTITDRDLEMLIMAYTYGGLTPDHVRHRHFPSSGARSACYTRIARLAAAGYFISKRLPALDGIGSGKTFLTPGPKARPLLAKALGISRSEVDRLRLDSPPFIQHHLAICDFRLAIERAADRSSIFTLQEFLGDHELRVAPTKVTDPGTKKVISFVPDALFTLALGSGDEQTFVVEMDLGTVSPKRMREKLRAYLIKAKKQPLPVLFVTPDQNRSEAIARYAEEEAPTLKGDATMFWVTTRGQVSEKTVLNEPIWQVIGGPRVALASLAGGQDKPSAVNGEVIFAGGLR